MKQSKTCRKCGCEAQPLANFYRDRSQPSGHDELCKTHRKQVGQAYRERHRPQERTRALAHRQRHATLPLQAPQLAVHSVVAVNGQRYRIESLQGLSARLSSGQWVPQSALGV